MSRPFKDPSLLTKDRLKKELESNGVNLPRGDQKKEFYVKLYLENLSPQSGRRLRREEFSSDDDDYEQSSRSKQIVPRSSRAIKKVGPKDIVTVGEDIKSMSDEELVEELSHFGQSTGPVIASTRDLYQRKLARLRASSPNNAGTIARVTNTEFSDNDFGEEQEENMADDEFFNERHGEHHTDSGFGSTFSKNFENSSSKKEVTRDFSVSSSRNVERSSTFDRKTINKVRTKKGDKFEEKKWTSSHGGDGDEEESREEQRNELDSLPTSVKRALTAAKRWTPEKENGINLRARPRKQPLEEASENKSPTSVEEKPKENKIETRSRKWWILVPVVLLLILFAAVLYNFERLPAIKQPPSSSPRKKLA